MSLVRTGFVPVPPGPTTGFDHADVWLGEDGSRMYVAHTGADRVDVLDCHGRTFLRSLPGLPGVAGVLIDEDHDLLFTSEPRCCPRQRLSVLRRAIARACRCWAPPKRSRLRAESPASLSFNLGEPIGEHCSASVIDLGSLEVMGEVPRPGRTRWALYDPDRDLVYVNIRHPAQIAVIDARRIALDDAFAVPCEGPHGLWLDAGRLFCACDGGELIVLDDNRNIIASLPLPGTPDVVMLDPKVERVYVAVGDPGVVCSFDTRRLEQIETVETELGAHTAAWDPVDRSLYVFCPRTSGAIIYAER
jgi:DNA-binding beta-propeller fold protein YncE